MFFNMPLQFHFQNSQTNTPTLFPTNNSNNKKTFNTNHSHSYSMSISSICASILLILSVATTPTSAQVNLQHAVIPQISNSLGSMGIVGRYDGVSKYQFVEQLSQQVQNDTFYDSILAQVDDQYYVPLNKSNGLVHSSCQMNDMLFLYGNFTTFGSASTPQGLAQFNMSDLTLSALNAPDLLSNGGSISTLYCHEPANQLFVGGSFSFKNSSGAAVFNVLTQSWDIPTFGGFRSGSTINAIIATNSSSADSSIVFGGKFIGLANDSLVSGNSLVDPSVVETQRISFGSANIFAEGSASNSDPRSIICPSGQSSNWKMSENRVGSWTSQWPIYINPTSIRLYNLNDETNGVSIFRVLSFPSNGIMNLTYVDQTTKKEMYCDAWCSLPKHSEQEYVDFKFVNVIGTNEIKIELLDFYGTYAGLSGIEMFQKDSFTYANNSYNPQDTCKDDGKSFFSAKSELTGQFSRPNGNSPTYVSSQVTESAQALDLSVVYQPNITMNGNYTMMLFTPGCIQDGTCSTRGGVNVTVQPSSNSDPIHIVLYETNDYDKYDYVYNGTMEKISDGFRPSVTVRPLLNQNVPFTFVSDRLKTVLVSIQEGLSINTIFEYLPSNFTSDNTSPVGNTTINQAGLFLDKESEVFALSAPTPGEILVGGNLTSKSLGRNIFKISNTDNGEFSGVEGSGLNNVVKSFVPISDSYTLVLGNFTGFANLSTVASNSVKSLNHIAFMSNSDVTFTSLGDGTNGPVTHAGTFSINGTDNIVFNGNFTELMSSNANYSLSDGSLPVWIANQSSWIQHSSYNTTFLQGRITSNANHGKTRYYTGFLRYFSSLSSGASFTDPQFNLTPMPYTFVQSNTENSTSSQNTLKKRTLVSSLDGNSIYSGTFVNSSFSVLGGHFQVQSNDGLIYNNIIMTENQHISGLPNNTIDRSSTFYSLYVDSNILYAGGSITGTVNNNQVNGLVFYDLGHNSYSSIQPPGLTGGSGIVNSIARQPNSNMLIVAGGFELAGSLACSTMCMYDLTNTRWLSPSPGLGGEVTSMTFLGNDVVVLAGALSLNNTNVSIATYDFSSRKYTTYGQQSTGLPGPIGSMVLNGEALESIFASGIDSTTNEYYVAHWNGTWNIWNLGLNPGTVVSDLEILQLTSPHESNSVLPNNQVLLLVGNIGLGGRGNVSSVMFDGNTLEPVFLTGNKDGSTGTINSFFSQEKRAYRDSILKKHMKKGFVILIALAIAVGLTFIIMALGILFVYFRKYQEGYIPANSRVSEMSMAETVPPAQLLEEMKHIPGKRATTGIGAIH